MLAAGEGIRAGARFHKALLPAGGQAVISHIIDRIPLEHPLIIITGHQAELLRDYCGLAHPQREITWVHDPLYGRGPRISLCRARHLLQQPFYLGCCDSIVEGLPALDRNWIAVAPTQHPDRYSTASMAGERVTAFKDKDAAGLPFAFTGLCGICDHAAFWASLDRAADTNFINAFSDPEFAADLYAFETSWHDCGNPEGLEAFAKAQGAAWVLPKDVRELTYHVGPRFVKLYLDPETCRQKVERAFDLAGLVPALVDTAEHGFAYNWVPGRTMYHVRDQGTWTRLWDWLQHRLFSRTVLGACGEFGRWYEAKTRERLELIRARRIPEVNRIDGVPVRPLAELVDAIPFWRLGGAAGLCHGDLHPENIIAREDGGFTLIDWRSEFAGARHFDRYYDLGKLYSGLLVDYRLALTRDPEMEREGADVWLTPLREPWLDTIREGYEEWLIEHGYDLPRVRLMAALVHLNIAPLHEPPLDAFLLYTARKERRKYQALALASEVNDIMSAEGCQS